MRRDIRDVKTLAILGSGVTAKAVTEAAQRLGLGVVVPEEADLVVASPGIPPSTFPMVSAEIVSEIEFAYRYLMTADHPPILVGITGTNGKSTVTAMVGHVCGCPLAGNIGIPLVTYLGKPLPSHIAVELSSYQLETCSTLRTHVAIVLGLTPDHIDRHPTMVAYAAAKARLVQSQRTEDLVIYDPQNVWSEAIAQRSAAKRCSLSDKDPLYLAIASLAQDPSCVGLIGKHNLMNALAAGHAARFLGVADPVILERLRTYVPLPHRIEYVGTLRGCRVFNDSKATNPDSTLVALAAFSAPFHLILGGKDKGLELHEFAVQVASRASSVTLFGEIADRMAATFAGLTQVAPPMAQVTTLQEALAAAQRFSVSGDVILFSPACSSFDQFQSFEHRGDVFRSMVQQLAADEMGEHV